MNPVRILLILILAGGLAVPAQVGAEATVFDETFVRETGAPFTDGRIFEARGGSASILVLNGDDPGTAVAAADIRVNGEKVFAPSDFRRSFSSLETEISLLEGENNIEVVLMGKPRGILRVVITQEASFSGTYCLILFAENADRTSRLSLPVSLEQSGDSLTFTVSGVVRVSGTGTVNGNTAVLSGEVPGEGTVTLILVLGADGRTVTGTYSVAGEEGEIEGMRGACTDYQFPAGDPDCILPVRDMSLVTGGQQYAPPDHTGLDFMIRSPLPDIVAPCDGLIVQISRHPISLGNIIHDVVIQYNNGWTTFIAFEPYRPDPEIADLQEAEISVYLNQVVRRGDLLGRLVVPGTTEFPHVHWGVNRTDTGDPVCPGDALSPEGAALLDSVYGSFGLLPACLP